MKQKITEFIYSHREEMVDTIRQLVEIPSVKGESKPGAPFGKEPRRALDKMLEICRNMGFVTSCHDDVMGTADYSPAGNVALGILGHLDVVPAEPLNWSCPPTSSRGLMESCSAGELSTTRDPALPRCTRCIASRSWEFL